MHMPHHIGAMEITSSMQRMLGVVQGVVRVPQVVVQIHGHSFDAAWWEPGHTSSITSTCLVSGRWQRVAVWEEICDGVQVGSVPVQRYV